MNLDAKINLTIGVLGVAIIAYSMGHSKGVRDMAMKLSAATSKELGVYLAAKDYFDNVNPQ